jgi:hypothetical protein
MAEMDEGRVAVNITAIIAFSILGGLSAFLYKCDSTNRKAEAVAIACSQAGKEFVFNHVDWKCLAHVYPNCSRTDGNAPCIKE